MLNYLNLYYYSGLTVFASSESELPSYLNREHFLSLYPSLFLHLLSEKYVSCFSYLGISVATTGHSSSGWRPLSPRALSPHLNRYSRPGQCPPRNVPSDRLCCQFHFSSNLQIFFNGIALLGCWERFDLKPKITRYY